MRFVTKVRVVSVHGQEMGAVAEVEDASGGQGDVSFTGLVQFEITEDVVWHVGDVLVVTVGSGQPDPG